MKKEKTVRSYTRKTKSGKSVQVRQHTASYESADEMAKQALKNKKGAGDELKSAKKKIVEDDNDYGFSASDYKEWYNWDMNEDPKNSAALKVEKALKKKLGRKGYQKYFDDMSDNYTSRGANKNFKGLSKLFDSSAASTKSKTEKIPELSKKKETKGDRAVTRMHKLVNEALSSTTSDPKALKKQLRALIDYNGGPINYGNKIGKRIDEIREQLGKRSSKKRVDKKSDYDYETSMKNLENYFTEERRKITSKGKTSKPKAPLTSLQKHAINALYNRPGWNDKNAEKYVRSLSDRDIYKILRRGDEE